MHRKKASWQCATLTIENVHLFADKLNFEMYQVGSPAALEKGAIVIFIW